MIDINIKKMRARIDAPRSDRRNIERALI